MRMEILLPELGAAPAAVSVWFADPGEAVYEGDRLVEILVGGATFDVSSPATGRLIGKHPMAPVLSPKKTWEGAAGGMAAAVAAAIGINRFGPILSGIAAEVGFGITVGFAAMLGDLAESLIKRDCGRKDASQVVPGFGGVLDILDSILFAAPVAYCWLAP